MTCSLISYEPIAHSCQRSIGSCIVLSNDTLNSSAGTRARQPPSVSTMPKEPIGVPNGSVSPLAEVCIAGALKRVCGAFTSASASGRRKARPLASTAFTIDVRPQGRALA